MAMIIRTTGAHQLIEGENEDKTMTLKQMQQAVAGYIEQVVLQPGCAALVWGYTHAYCNEEGKLEGLEANPDATRYAGTVDDFLVGDVIFCTDGPAGKSC